jgi:pimeloyl-ACP methyl ester carboxylesterase
MKRLITVMQLLALMALTDSGVTGEPFSSDSPQATKPPARDAEKVPTIESGYVQVEGGKIFYEAAGQGPVIVMIHDGLLHRETWNAQFDAFAKHYRVIRWDRRGYGRSGPPTTPFSQLDDLYAVMKALKVERATLLGCSAGGLLAIHFALDHPQMVTALVLVGPIVTGLGFSDHFTSRGNRGRPGSDATVDQRIEYWTSKDPWIMSPESIAAKQTMRTLLTANRQNLEGTGQQLARWPDQPALGRLSQIKVPTLLVVGESDIPDVHSHVGAIQAGIAASKRVVLNHSGHLPHVEVPDAFNEVVLGFLKDNK